MTQATREEEIAYLTGADLSDPEVQTTINSYVKQYNLTPEYYQGVLAEARPFSGFHTEATGGTEFTPTFNTATPDPIPTTPTAPAPDPVPDPVTTTPTDPVPTPVPDPVPTAPAPVPPPVPATTTTYSTADGGPTQYPTIAGTPKASDVFKSPTDYTPITARQTYDPQVVDKATELMTTPTEVGVSIASTPAPVLTGNVSVLDPTTLTGTQTEAPTDILASTINAVKQAKAAEGTAAQAELSAAELMESVQGQLPPEALVSEQLQALLKTEAGQDVPAFALPALKAAEDLLAARGMGKSSVAKEAIMSAIVQSAIPIAQQNAQTVTQQHMANLQMAQQKAVNDAAYKQQLKFQNLTNAQQTALQNTQNIQQAMLTNVASENAAKQFNASSENQTKQFMVNLKATIDNQNAVRVDTAAQFANNLKYQQEALNAGNTLEAEKFNAQMESAIDQFNSNITFQKDQFNTQQALAIEQSNVQWRRQINTANTAGQNAVNQNNAINAFNMTAQAMANLWQEQRDAANWAQQTAITNIDAKTRMAIAAMGNETIKDTETGNTLVEAGKLAWDIIDG